MKIKHLIIAIAALYTCFVFACQDFDPFNWKPAIAGAFAYCLSCCFALYGAYWFSKKVNN